MKTQAEIRAELPSFYGTEHYYRFSVITPNVLLTDGTKYLAESAGAYWLMDVIASHLPAVEDGFAIATLTKTDTGAHFTLSDDDPPSSVWATQDIEYTDFPLDEVKLFVISNGSQWVILLPSEY